MPYTRPDPKLTPGVWSNTLVQRHVTLGTKLAVYRAYRIPILKRLGYVIDHLVPLEIGGTNDLGNLWPQPRSEAKVKDRRENVLAFAVQAGQMTRAEAQQAILKEWGPS